MTNSTKPEEKFHFFWGGPFSQWHYSEFTDPNYPGITFKNAEMYMMFRKNEIFRGSYGDKILNAKSPSECKKFGRLVENFDPAVWEKHDFEIVFKGNYLKFTQNPDLLEELLDTEGTTLVEASPYDKIWGIGLYDTDPRAQSRDTWEGQNKLGECLTMLRDYLLFAAFDYKLDTV